MARKIKLTATEVNRLLLKPGRYRDDCGIRGLLLVVVNKRAASWQLRYQVDGRERWLGLGPARIVSLKQARERARAARLQLHDGIDPIEAKRSAKMAVGLLRFDPQSQFKDLLGRMMRHETIPRYKAEGGVGK